MSWLSSIGIDLCRPRSGGSGGTPTPTPSIGTPVLTQTSTAGATPFTWSLAEDATFMPGYYWHVMRATTSTFPAVSNNIVINGDSWDGSYVGYYAGYWMSLHTSAAITNISQGGRTIGASGTVDANTLTYTEGQVASLRPAVYYAGSGANDLASYASGALWAADLKAHFQRVLDATPGVLLVGRTPCALGTGTGGAALHNANRPAAVAAMRQWLTDGFLSGLVDFAANSSIGDDADMIPVAASNTAISTDGVHLYARAGVSTGHDIASPIFATAMDAVIALVPALTGEAVQQIVTDDLSSTATIVFTDLTATPTGSLYLRERVGRDTGTGGYTWGGWSNVLHDTIAVSFNATFDSAKRTTFGGQSGTISNGGLTYTSYDFGSDITFRCATATALANAIGVVEFTMPTTGIQGDDAFGLVNSAYDYSGPSTNLGSTNSFGIRKDVGGVAGVYTNSGLIDTPPVLASGATYQMVVHKATGKAWIRYPGGTWYPDTPTFNSNGTVASGTGYATGLTDFQFAVCSNRGGAFTINAGQGAFAQTPPTNATLGWA